MITPAPRLVDITEEHLPQLLELNNSATPHVGALDADRLRALVDWAWWAVTTPEMEALMLVLPPGVPYGSPNYRWIDARWRSFAYIDRIAVTAERRGAGIGRLLYDTLAERARRAGYRRLVCEVNVRPPNPASIAFHEHMGFRRTGIRADSHGGGAVAMMARTIA